MLPALGDAWCYRQLESFQIEFNTVVWANRTIATTANLDRAGRYVGTQAGSHWSAAR